MELEDLKKQTPKSMWLYELNILQEQYQQYQLNRRERQKGSGKKKVKRKKKNKVIIKK